MPTFTCTICGTPYAASEEQPTACSTCLDERQHVEKSAPQWTTLEPLRLTNRNPESWCTLVFGRKARTFSAAHGEIDSALRRFTASQDDPVALLRGLMDAIRPPDGRDGEAATTNWRAMNSALAANDSYRQAVSAKVLELFATRRLLSFFSEEGILPLLPRSTIGARGADGAALARRAGAKLGRARVTAHEQAGKRSLAALRRSGLRQGKRSVRDQLAVTSPVAHPEALRAQVQHADSNLVHDVARPGRINRKAHEDLCNLLRSAQSPRARQFSQFASVSSTGARSTWGVVFDFTPLV